MRRLALALALVAGCSSGPEKRPGGYYKDDGPPDRAPNLAAVPDAVPRHEPLHRWANRPYEALGKRFVPLTRVGAFQQRGTASWYGKRFHGLTTRSASASPPAITIASPSLVGRSTTRKPTLPSRFSFGS